MNITGPIFFTPIVYKYLKSHPEKKTVIFPTSFFYAYPSNNREAIRGDTEANRIEVHKSLTSDSYCLHLWYCSWQ